MINSIGSSSTLFFDAPKGVPITESVSAKIANVALGEYIGLCATNAVNSMVDTTENPTDALSPIQGTVLVYANAGQQWWLQFSGPINDASGETLVVPAYNGTPSGWVMISSTDNTAQGLGPNATVVVTASVALEATS